MRDQKGFPRCDKMRGSSHKPEKEARFHAYWRCVLWRVACEVIITRDICQIASGEFIVIRKLQEVARGSPTAKLTD